MFANCLGDLGSIPGRVYQRLQKWYLMPPCLTQHYKERIKCKVEKSGERSIWTRVNNFISYDDNRCAYSLSITNGKKNSRKYQNHVGQRMPILNYQPFLCSQAENIPTLLENTSLTWWHQCRRKFAAMCNLRSEVITPLFIIFNYGLIQKAVQLLLK